MMEFPLLPIPPPEFSQRPRGSAGFPPLRFPEHQRQVQRINPVFQRLQEVLARAPLTLQRDIGGIAPERALVLDVAGSVDRFYEAVGHVEGLEFLNEFGAASDPDEDFHLLDKRKGQEGNIRYDKVVGGQLYLTMPDLRALRELVGLWNRYKTRQSFDTGFAPWRNVFEQLRDIRAWGPRDRLSEEVIDYMASQLAVQSSSPIRIEVEVWSYKQTARQRAAIRRVQEAVHTSGGEVIHQTSIPEIAYEAALIDLPVHAIRSLIAREEVALTICDDVMLIRPQSAIRFPTQVDSVDDGEPLQPSIPSHGLPIVGLLDGVPVQRHHLLDTRIVFDDPDSLNDLSIVSERRHGTEMASLIIYGDRHCNQPPLRRPIYLRPVLYASGNGADERPQPDRLLIDTVYRAILRMKVGDGDDRATAPTVFIVNLSLGDENRPFAGSMSPWGRLLDHLADRFGILFIVSAGNIHTPLPVRGLCGIEEMNSSEVRQEAILAALGEQRPVRTLLSPAEALNVITVGAWYEDAVNNLRPSHLEYEPYLASGPNITSAMGLGYSKVIKPDIFMPGGRERIIVAGSSESEMKVGAAPPSRRYGLKAAIPDSGGRLDQEGLTSGTSGATALASRAAHRLFDAMMDDDNGAILANADPMYYGVVVKALLAHRARWGEMAGLLNRIYGPHGRGKHVERGDNIARVLGYGAPNVEDAMSCAPNQATLIGHGEIAAGEGAYRFRVPLPLSLDRVAEPRSVTLTLAWFSPVNARRQMYRRAKLDIRPDDFDSTVGVTRASSQPSDKSVPRGTLFHVRYEGSKAVEFVDEGHLRFKVSCREQGGPLDHPIKYGLAITIEAGEHVPVYQEVRGRLAVLPRAPT